MSTRRPFQATAIVAPGSRSYRAQRHQSESTSTPARPWLPRGGILMRRGCPPGHRPILRKSGWGLHERLAQDAVREAGAAAEALAGTLVVARAEARPGGGMASGAQAAHVAAESGDDRLGGAAGHRGDGVEARDRGGLGGDDEGGLPSAAVRSTADHGVAMRPNSMRRQPAFIATALPQTPQMLLFSRLTPIPDVRRCFTCRNDGSGGLRQ